MNTKKIKNLQKSQISHPTDFRLVQHVGIENGKFRISLKGSDETSLKMLDLLKEWNVPANKKVEKLINSFLETHGGVDKLNEELHISKPKEDDAGTTKHVSAIKRSASTTSTASTSEPKLKRQSTLPETRRSKRDLQKKLVKKNEIGEPYDFKVLQNIVVENGKFKINLSSDDEISRKIKYMLFEINVPRTRKTELFINEFIETHGGMEKFVRELELLNLKV